MPRFLSIFFLSAVVLLASCRGHEVCSGLNPTLATYNSNKKLRKGGRALKSAPEREAHKHRLKSNKKKAGLKSRGAYSGKGLFHLHIGHKASEARS